ncbi:hypothetical protein WG66_001314 [Moniliophthora roreri]|nr:hypothetical protein WG66_001314 [Moniliophthora roreri]
MPGFKSKLLSKSRAAVQCRDGWGSERETVRSSTRIPMLLPTLRVISYPHPGGKFGISFAG